MIETPYTVDTLNTCIPILQGYKQIFSGGYPAYQRETFKVSAIDYTQDQCAEVAFVIGPKYRPQIFVNAGQYDAMAILQSKAYLAKRFPERFPAIENKRSSAPPYNDTYILPGAVRLTLVATENALEIVQVGFSVYRGNSRVLQSLYGSGLESTFANVSYVNMWKLSTMERRKN